MTAITLDELKALSTPGMIKSQLDGQVVLTLTAGDDDLIITSIKAAARWVFAAMARCGALSKTLSADEQDILAGAMEKRAIYELYTRSEVEASAEDKKDDAMALLKAVLGDCADPDAAPKPYVGGSVTKAPPASSAAGGLTHWGTRS